MKNFKAILRIEGILLSLIGIIPIIYLVLFMERTATSSLMLVGGLVFGVAYLWFGISYLLGQTRLLLPGLVINAAGSAGALVIPEYSMLAEVDPNLIIAEIVCLPLLIYLNMIKRNLVAQEGRDEAN